MCTKNRVGEPWSHSTNTGISVPAIHVSLAKTPHARMTTLVLGMQSLSHTHVTVSVLEKKEVSKATCSFFFRKGARHLVFLLGSCVFFIPNYVGGRGKSLTVSVAGSLSNCTQQPGIQDSENKHLNPSPTPPRSHNPECGAQGLPNRHPQHWVWNPT